MPSNDSGNLHLELSIGETGSGSDSELASKELVYVAAAVVEETTTEGREKSTGEDSLEPPPGTFLSCKAANAEGPTGAPIRKFDLKWDYEIHTAAGADLSSAVNEFEFSVLQVVAKDFDMLDCEFTERRHLKRHLMKDYVLNISNDAPAGLTRIESYPFDRKHSHGKCKVSGSDIATKCIFIIGGMTAWIADNPSVVEKEIYATIEQHSKDYATHGVTVSYLGMRPVPVAIAPVIAMANRDNGDTKHSAAASRSLLPGAIAGIFIASFLIVLTILTMVMWNRRQKKAEREEVPVNEVRETSLVDRSLVEFDEEDPTSARSKCDWSEANVSGCDRSERAKTIFPNGTMGSEPVQILPNETMMTADSFEVKY